MNRELLDYMSMGQASHDLPPVEIPRYKIGKHGDWQITKNNPRFMIRGYFNGLQAPAAPNYVLSRTDTNEVWMSLTPMELESHAYHVLWASGRVVIGGLGLGMYLYNVMRKPEVTEVIVVEFDEQIIASFRDFIDDDVWAKDWEPYWHKVSIVCGDIKDMTCDTLSDADYLYVDIWANMMDSEALTDMSIICGNLKPKMSGWWCQEGDYAQMVIEGRSIGQEHISHTQFAEDRLKEKHGIITCGSKMPDGNRKLESVVQNLMNM